jgi:hypothetical protein
VLRWASTSGFRRLIRSGTEPVPHPMSRTRCLIDQLTLDRLFTQPPLERIVERQKPIVPRRWEEVLAGLFLHAPRLSIAD